MLQQEINVCRCDYVFCDSHKHAEQHQCDFDHRKLGQDALAKSLPKPTRSIGRDMHRLGSED